MRFRRGWLRTRMTHRLIDLSLHPSTMPLSVEAQHWLEAIERGAFGVWDLDPAGDMVHYSAGWKARLGFPRIHAPDATSFWRCRVHPDDVQAMLDALSRYLDGHTPVYEAKFRLRSNGSGYRTVLSRGRVVARDGLGQATRMVGTMVDLTPRPVSPAPAGLVAEDESETGPTPAMPLLGALAALASRNANGGDTTIEPVHDLLALALRDSLTAA